MSGIAREGARERQAAAPAFEDFSVRGTLSIVGLGAMGYALSLSNGMLHPSAFWLTALTLAIACIVFTLRERVIIGPLGVLPPLVGFGLLTHAVSIHLAGPPGMYMQGGPEIYGEHHALIAAVAVLFGVLLSAPSKVVLWTIPLMFALYLRLGHWLLRASPSPYIDVWVFHNASFEALRQGISPYGINVPNIYGNGQYYGVGVADNSRVFIGYPYPPISLLLTWLAHLVKGDYRYANLLAQVCSAGFLAYARPSRMSALAAALFLFTPRGLFVLEQGWSDVFSALALTGTVFCAVRSPRALPWVFGLLVGVKQYFVFAIPLVPLLLDSWDVRVLGRFLLKASIIPIVVTVPFVLWDPHGFINSVILCQMRQPFRPDALSVMAWLVARGGPMLPLNISFGLALVAVAIALWRSERSASGFAAALSVTMLFFFFFAKQAFANYYYFTLACLAATAATSLAPSLRARLGEASATQKGAPASLINM